MAWNQWKLRWAKSYYHPIPFTTICAIMGFSFFSTLVKHMLMLTSDMLIGFASSTIVRDLRRPVICESASDGHARNFSKLHSTFLAAITSGTDGLAMGLVALFGVAIREPLRVISCLALACFISWRLLFLSVILAPLLVAIVVFFNKKIRSIASSILGRNAGLHEIILESLNNI